MCDCRRELSVCVVPVTQIVSEKAAHIHMREGSETFK